MQKLAYRELRWLTVFAVAIMTAGCGKTASNGAPTPLAEPTSVAEGVQRLEPMIEDLTNAISKNRLATRDAELHDALFLAGSVSSLAESATEAEPDPETEAPVSGQVDLANASYEFFQLLMKAHNRAHGSVADESLTNQQFAAQITTAFESLKRATHSSSVDLNN